MQDDPISQAAENLPQIDNKEQFIQNQNAMLDLNQILATLFDKFKFSPKIYSALAILGSVLAIVSMNPEWLPFSIPADLARFIGAVAVALLAITGSRTTSYLNPPTVSDEMKADAGLQKVRFGVN